MGRPNVLSLHLSFWTWRNVSLKCDLNPVFRRKGALLWPPLHPSPHFHQPCHGRRTKVLKRLSTAALGPHLVGHRKSTGSLLPFLPLSGPFTFLSLPKCRPPSLLCCMSQPSTGCPSPPDTFLHQHHPHCAATQVELCGCVKEKPRPDPWAGTCACDQASDHFNAFRLMQNPVKQMMLNFDWLDKVCF